MCEAKSLDIKDLGHRKVIINTKEVRVGVMRKQTEI